MTTPTLGRREKLGSSVRTALNEQLGRVQIKHMAEIEVLDDMRNFLKQRTQIEREYSQNIQRLCQQNLAKKDIRPPPDLDSFSKRDNRGILEMWKITLEKTDELGKGRAALADMLQDNILESLKDLKRRKEQQFKKYFEVAQRMISEVLDTVKDLTITKKLYKERWKTSEEARTKFTDADGRLKNSQLKLFETRGALERTQKKTGERFLQTQRHSTVARNEYLLSLEVTNTHLRKHFITDIPLIMKEIDGDMYDKVQESYLLYAQIEVDSAIKMRAEFEDLREQSVLVNRDYVMACFLHEHQIFNDKIVYAYESSPGDRLTAISKEHGSEIYLEREAKKYAQNLIKLNKSIVEKGKTVKGLQSVTQAYTITPEFGTSDATAEAQQTLFEIQEDLRQITVQTNRINSRLDLLKSIGIDVDKWLSQAAQSDQSNGGGQQHHSDKQQQQQQQQQSDLMDLTTKSLQSQTLSNSNLSLAEGDTTSLRSEALTDVMSVNSNFSEPYTPNACVALYAYQAQRPDELDILSDEELEVLEWDDGDGWSKGKNKQGKEGYFPQSYVKSLSRPNSPTSNRGVSSLASDFLIMNTTSELKKSNGGLCPETVKENVMLKALFEYNAQDEEELSFPEGAIIKLLRTDDNGIDDGWWEGRYEGKVGVFPSVVVEVTKDDSLEDITPCSSEIFPTEPSSPPPVPPPPSYPAPEISVWDLTIGPHIKSVSNPSSTLPSPAPTRTVINSIPSSTPDFRGSRQSGEMREDGNATLNDSFDMQNSFEETLQNPAPTRTVINSIPSSTPDFRGSRQSGEMREDGNATLNDSFDMQNSFEETLQNQDNWSSFEDVIDDEDVSYV